MKNWMRFRKLRRLINLKKEPLLSGFFFTTLSLLTSGCSTLNTPAPLPANTSTPNCLTGLTQLDKLAEQHAGTLHDQRLPNTPWLRSNRFLASFNNTPLNKQQLATLLRRMQQSANHGLKTEIALIPAAQLRHWQKHHQIRGTAHAFINNCATQLVKQQLKNSAQTRAWLAQLNIRDSYSTLQRIAGFYPLAAIPFRLGVVREQQELRGDWGKIQGRQWTSYTPAFPLSAPAPLQRDSLSIARLTTRQTQQLLQQYAPTWLIDSTSAANRPGSPYLQQDKLKVATHQPATYASVSFGRWKNQVTTQLNYLIWFKERPPLRRLDWVAGQHDAVIFRIHLDAEQKIIAYDSIHLCGCWYRLFLPTTANYQNKTTPATEPVLATRVDSAPRMEIYLSRDTHQIIYLQPASRRQTAIPYQLQAFNRLLSLPAFNNSGYVPGSERPERWLFWPMGVRNPGALRRFGEHAISFVGKRHFDDPYLLENIGMY